MQAWFEAGVDPKIFPEVVRPFFNLMVTSDNFREVPLLLFLHDPKICDDPECRRLLKTIFAKVVSVRGLDFLGEWEAFLKTHNIRISSNFVCEIVTAQAGSGMGGVQKQFLVPLHSTTQTHKQTCTITTRTGQAGPPPVRFPPIVVWNGNGVRARWTAPHNELKALVHVINPDLLCFLEAKTDAEKLLQLQGFEEWVNERGFSHLFCYWSVSEGKTARGCEGILIFSKVPCKVTYGLGNPGFDQQARVVTIDFAGVLFVVSYNPQGGFPENSLGFREKWEKAFQKFLQRVKVRGEREKKG